MKDALREEMRRLRAERAPAEAADASAAVCRRVVRLPAYRAARRIAVYRAMPCEIDVDALAREALAADRSVCVPAYDARAKRYRMARWEAGTAWRAGAYGIAEPVSPGWVETGTLDAILVPGLAFDLSGHRLGHGGGHYDAFLHGLAACRIGVCFAWQLVGRVPAAAHDEPVDWVVTPAAAHGVRPPVSPSRPGDRPR